MEFCLACLLSCHAEAGEGAEGYGPAAHAVIIFFEGVLFLPAEYLPFKVLLFDLGMEFTAGKVKRFTKGVFLQYLWQLAEVIAVPGVIGCPGEHAGVN